MQHVSLCLCSLLAATSQFTIPIGQKMQLTGGENANNVRNATCAASKTSKVPTQDALLFISYSMVEFRSICINSIYSDMCKSHNSATGCNVIIFFSSERLADIIILNMADNLSITCTLKDLEKSCVAILLY